LLIAKRAEKLSAFHRQAGAWLAPSADPPEERTLLASWSGGDAESRTLPRFVHRELKRSLACGDLAAGLAW
jgi:hypothetical protein